MLNQIKTVIKGKAKGTIKTTPFIYRTAIKPVMSASEVLKQTANKKADRNDVIHSLNIVSFYNHFNTHAVSISFANSIQALISRFPEVQGCRIMYAVLSEVKDGSVGRFC